MLKRTLKFLISQFNLWTGISLYEFKHSFPTPTKYFAFKREFLKLKSQIPKDDDLFPITKLYPCFKDKNAESGSIGDYFFQDLHVAQRIFQNNPVRHIDVGSRIDGFVAHVASFRKIETLDIRELNSNIPNLFFSQCDIMCKEKIESEITDSISCLHVLEHLGLGRYGDPICYNGDIIGFENMTKMLKKGGIFYLSVPIGKQRIEFHAHRVFSISYLLKMISDNYKINQFSYYNAGNFYPNVELTQELIDSNCGCMTGIGIFEMTKIKNTD